MTDHFPSADELRAERERREREAREAEEAKRRQIEDRKQDDARRAADNRSAAVAITREFLDRSRTLGLQPRETVRFRHRFDEGTASRRVREDVPAFRVELEGDRHPLGWLVITPRPVRRRFRPPLQVEPYWIVTTGTDPDGVYLLEYADIEDNPGLSRVVPDKLREALLRILVEG